MRWKCPRLNVILWAILLGACDQKPSSAPPATTKSDAATTNPRVRIGPKFTLLDPVVDFGLLEDYETETTEVRFTNSGDQPLEVKQVQPTCGCTTVKLDKRIFAPGEGDAITLKFTPKGIGEQTKYVKIHTTDPKVPVTNLPIKSNVRASVEATPRTFVIGEIPLGEEYRTSRTLIGHNPAYVPTSISISGDLKPYAVATLIETTPESAEKRTWRIDLVLQNNLPWGDHAGNATVRGTIKTPDRIYPHTYLMGMMVSAEGRIRAGDSMFRFSNINPGKSISKSIELTLADQAPFAITGTIVQGKGKSYLSASAAPTDASHTTWTITLSGTAPQRSGVIDGAIIVQSDVPGEEVISIRYVGNFRTPR